MSRSPAAPFDVNGRTVFITGAARGIGAATAERLHAKGANVALVGLEPERLEELAARLGDRAAWFEADVTDYDALERAVRDTVARFGALDVAMANAGIAYVGSLATAPIEHVERTLAVNFLGVWRTDRAVIKHIMERKGYLLNIASLAALSHAPLMGPYTASKAGVEALTDALRQETIPSGGRVGCAYFGFIDTDLVRGSFSQPSANAMMSRAPGFLRNPIPLSRAVDAIESGIERRAARLWAPRWVGPMLTLRGLLQPLTERQTASDTQGLSEGLRLADPASGQTTAEDPLLGVAAKVL
ncbi:MAG TPA: short-chain dehydrogenase/reductase [Solirubrobacteraceae bacterium]|jgi:NAD(P)-dependent dehydrogenase (short-subunit alcohol dehydrogenase family)